MLKVVKRDKTVELFSFDKIHKAISKAFQSQGLEAPDDVLDCVKETYDLNSDESVHVEDIQDKVEHCLMATYPDVAKAYIIYRFIRSLLREKDTKLVKDMKKKINATHITNQNANVDESSFGGRQGEVTRLVMKDYALYHCMSRKARKNHLANEIYKHDLDSYAVGMHNCLSVPFDSLLGKGFKTRQTDVRPANSINTAFQLVAVLFQIQSLQQFGGVSATHLDWTMVPFVRKSFLKHYIVAYLKDTEDFKNLDIMDMFFNTYMDEAGVERNHFDEWIDDNKADFFKVTGLKEEDFRLDNKEGLCGRYYQSALYDTITELRQAVEGMYHNLNTLQSRSGNQLPFTSINYGTCTSPEGRLVISALLQGSLNGVGVNHMTPIFPCGIFQCMKGVNRKPGEPNYDLFQLALKSTSRRLYPNYCNVDWNGNAGYDRNDPRTYFSTMGCRTANGWDINGFGQLKDGRGNICPVTIIMPTLAMRAGRDKDKFMKLLDKKIGEAKDELIDRFEHICSQPVASASFMWENNTMAGYIPEEGVRSALKHGTLAIGQLGLAETLQLLIGTDHTTPEGMELAIEIEKLFNKRCAEFKKEYNLNFGVYYTPAENLCYTAMTKFKAEFGIIEKVSDRDYFTNSMHVPVWHKMTPFEKIDIESQLTGYSNAGCITYIELESGVMHNIEALEEYVNYAMDHDIPYFAVNVPNCACLDCGYQGEFDGECPHCGSLNVIELGRVTGYLNGNYRTSFNPGKIKEFLDRVKHLRVINFRGKK